MGLFKNIFLLLLLIQICSVTLALPYKHADAEAFDFEQLFANHHDMDGETTKQKVVRMKLEPTGVTKTTTYKLDPSGGISSSTVIERKTNRRLGALPDSVSLDEAIKSPSSTVTRSYIDKDGAEVVETYSVSKPKTTSVFESDDNVDWFGGLPPPDHTFSSPNWPRLGRPNFSHPWKPISSFDDSDDWTVVESNPDVETTTKHKFPSWTPKTWNLPELPSIETTTTTTKPLQTKTTTPLPGLEELLKSQYGPVVTSTTTTTKTITTTPTSKTTTASTNNNSIPTKADKPLVFNLGESSNPMESKPNLNNLDPHVKETLQNAGISLEDITKIDGDTITTAQKDPNGGIRYTLYRIRTTPTITTTYEHTKHKVSSIPQPYTPQESPMVFRLADPNLNTGPVHRYPLATDILPRKVESSSKPNLSNLDPQIKEAILNAGISPEDITDINDDTITTKRKEPDGSIVTTMFKIPPAPLDSHSVFNAAGGKNPTETKPNLNDLDPQVKETLRKAGISLEDIIKIDGDTITTARKEPNGKIRHTLYRVRTAPTITTTYEQTKPKVFSIPPPQKPLESPMVFHLPDPNTNAGSVHRYPFSTDILPRKFESSSKPNLSNLDPQIQAAILKAGISPEDITDINDDTVTTKRKEPDGSIVTTTFKIPSLPTISTWLKVSPHSDDSLDPIKAFRLDPFEPHPNSSPISEFLAKFGMTKSDLLSKNGEYTKTIVEDDGQVLTATFILSSPIKTANDAMHKAKPVK